MTRLARFEPFQSRGVVRFFLQRPTGYMSAYSLRGALTSTRTSLRVQGSRDPLYVSLFGRHPIRLPALRGPVTPRKVRCPETTKTGLACQGHATPPETHCPAHRPQAPKPFQCTGTRKDDDRCHRMLATPGRCAHHVDQPADHPNTSTERTPA